MIKVVLVMVAAYLIAVVATSAVRRYAINIKLLDVPNARSSHAVPTPRGGGIAIVLASLFACLSVFVLAPDQALPVTPLFAAALVALVGFVDDHAELPPIWRLLIQGFASALVVLSLGGLPALPVFGMQWDLGPAGYVLAWLFLVWLLNLFNFMDGIDGIAGVQTVTVCVMAAICHLIVGAAPAVTWAAWGLAAAAAGFLYWNWPPAKIFMGDAGSGFIGFFIATLALSAAWGDGRLFWCWVLLMGVFVVDATVTLLRRMHRGEGVFTAHRSHGYQQASRHFKAHRPVTLAVLAINVIWLGFWAVLVALGRIDGALATCAAYVPLLVLAWYFRSGLPDSEYQGGRDRRHVEGTATDLMSFFLRLTLMPRRIKQLGLVAMDALVLPLVLYFAYVLRLGFLPSIEYVSVSIFVLLSAMTVLMLALVGVYKVVVRAFNESLLRDMVIGLIMVAVNLQVMNLLMPAVFMPKTVPFIYACLAFFWLWGSRTLIRAMVALEVHGEGEPVLIYGAGRTGRQLISALRSTELYPVALFDDDPELIGSTVAGLRVRSGKDLLDMPSRLAVRKLLLAMPSLSAERLREVVSQVEHLQVRVCAMPAVDQLASGQIQVSDMREVDIVDLLGRSPVAPDLELLHRNTRDQVVLVTGAGGSIGSEICRQVAACSPRKLILWEVTEYALYAIEQDLRRRWPDLDIMLVLGSVLETGRLERIMRQQSVDTIYHAAAYKHVPLVETNPFNGLGNNVLGTWCVAQAASAAGVSTFVLVSTDKAVRPTNVMGASKRLAELLLQALAAENPQSTRFVMVRFGNVLGSSGSVVPLFQAQIARGGPVTVTHPDITRYFMTIPEASQLVIQAGALGSGGEVFVLDMGEPVRIADLAVQMIQLSGRTLRSAEQPGGQIEIRYTGLRPGEKLYEELLIGGDVASTSHPRIRSAHEVRLPLADLMDVLDRLQQLWDRQDVAGLKALLGEVVAGYTPDMEAVGLCVDSLVLEPQAESCMTEAAVAERPAKPKTGLARVSA